MFLFLIFFFFSSRRRHTRYIGDWSSDVCSSDLGCAVILITHDLLDVFTLADRVLVLESGKISEIGPVPDVLTAPRSHFGARIAGINLVNGTIAPDGSLHARSGARWHATPTPEQRDQLSPGQNAIAVFPPTAVAVYREQPHGSPRNTVEVTVAEMDIRGSAVLVRGDQQSDGAPGLAAEITVDAASELRLTPGERVWFSVKAHEVALYPATHRNGDSLLRRRAADCTSATSVNPQCISQQGILASQP